MNELDAEAKTAGIIVMNEIGLDPGIDHQNYKRSPRKRVERWIPSSFIFFLPFFNYGSAPDKAVLVILRRITSA